ncbi:MAG: FMN-binding protein [Candidatus Omnitrophica bacterium]|nr:FMN-binding protein [Candidatus Omnitrophota bacterium]MCM8830854.1 FMN-binding protein [Candidatus Omnitrophota bacterium]
MKEILKYGFILFLICFFAASFLAKVYSVAKPRIEKRAKEEFQNNLRQLIQEGEQFLPIKIGDEIVYYKVYNKNNDFIGVIFKTQAKGYSSTINTLVAMSPSFEIIKLKVIEQKETPGLGSRITDKEFIEQFSKKQINEISKVNTITGATISSKAVISSVYEKAKKIKELLK